HRRPPARPRVRREEGGPRVDPHRRRGPPRRRVAPGEEDPRGRDIGVPMNDQILPLGPRTLDARYHDDNGSVLTTRVDHMVHWLLNWGRSNSVWYLLFGLACCAIELMQTGGPRADL